MTIIAEQTAVERGARIRLRRESYAKLVELARRDNRTPPAAAEELIKAAFAASVHLIRTQEVVL